MKINQKIVNLPAKEIISVINIKHRKEQYAKRNVESKVYFVDLEAKNALPSILLMHLRTLVKSFNVEQ